MKRYYGSTVAAVGAILALAGCEQRSALAPAEATEAAADAAAPAAAADSAADDTVVASDAAGDAAAGPQDMVEPADARKKEKKSDANY